MLGVIYVILVVGPAINIVNAIIVRKANAITLAIDIPIWIAVAFFVIGGSIRLLRGTSDSEKTAPRS